MHTLLLGLHSQTAIHAGSGQSDSVVDLPIQRESHTGYPCVFGSSMKGALRAHAEVRTNCGQVTIGQLFGQAGDDSGNAGATLISDARVLLLPMRSLTGQFRWVTSPSVMARFKADCKRFGQQPQFSIPKLECGQVLSFAKDETLFLEEYCFKKVGDFDAAFIDTVAPMLAYDDSAKTLTEQLVIIADDDFAYMAQYTMPVNAHIALDSQTKTNIGGALWYEETLPADSLLYAGISIEDARQSREHEAVTAAQLADQFKSLFPAEQSWLQVGGNETVGMGWCHVTCLEAAS